MRVLISLLAVLALAALAAPATANPEIVPTFRVERTYLHCQDDTVKVNNVAAAQSGTWAQWNTSPPSSSVTAGAGCGHAEYPVSDTSNRRNANDFVIEGTFTGNVRDLTVHLHDMGPVPRLPLTYNLYASLFIDGALVHEGTTAHRVVATEENEGVTHRSAFSFTGIDLGVEHGNGTIQRDFTIALRTSTAKFWVFDTTEVPAGVTFNPTSLETLRIEV